MDLVIKCISECQGNFSLLHPWHQKHRRCPMPRDSYHGIPFTSTMISLAFNSPAARLSDGMNGWAMKIPPSTTAWIFGYKAWDRSSKVMFIKWYSYYFGYSPDFFTSTFCAGYIVSSRYLNVMFKATKHRTSPDSLQPVSRGAEKSPIVKDGLTHLSAGQPTMAISPVKVGWSSELILCEFLHIAMVKKRPISFDDLSYL